MNLGELLYPLSFEGLGIALLCGAMVGMERQLSGKPAGIRTSALICIGSYVFTVVGGLIPGNVDPSRIVAQIVTGIGFIGAGVILAREGLVLGVTSASVIWVLAGVGILIGLGRSSSAVILSAVTVFILVGVSFLERMFLGLRKGVYRRLKKGELPRDGEG
jgi:putative Mg2+ transporter-C (MgtC) family protein